MVHTCNPSIWVPDFRASMGYIIRPYHKDFGYEFSVSTTSSL